MICALTLPQSKILATSMTWYIFSIDASIRCCFETTIPPLQPGCHVTGHLRSIGEELRHAETATALVVKQVRFCKIMKFSPRSMLELILLGQFLSRLATAQLSPMGGGGGGNAEDIAQSRKLFSQCLTSAGCW